MENLEGKVHEDDIIEVKNRWFLNLKEMCENVSFISWMQGESGMEEMVKKNLELYTPNLPDGIMKCIDITKYANELVKNEQYLITAHGIYSFDEPVY